MKSSPRNIALVTAICDPPGELLPKAERQWPALQHLFTAAAAHVTDDTESAWFAFLRERNVPTLRSPPAWDHIGLHRRRSLAIGLERTECDSLFYADPDHILRWVERNPTELDTILNQVGSQDCLIVGRSKRSYNALPVRLRETEAVVNRIYAMLTGHPWDLMMAARGLTRRGAELIVGQSTEDTIGNDVAWPLQIEQHGMSLGYTQADGLTYETNRDYAENTVDSLDQDPSAWMLRVYAANQQVNAMRPFLPHFAPE